MAERSIQDATPDDDSELRCRELEQRLQEVLNEGGLVRARRKSAQDKHTELERSVEQLRHDHVTGGGGEGDGAAVRRGRRLASGAHRQVQNRLQCMTPCRKRVAEVASPLAAEAARVSTSWHYGRNIVQTFRPSTITSPHRRRSK